MSGLPSDLDYSLKKAAPRGVRCFRTQLAPIGGISTTGFSGTDQIKYDIPVGRRGQYIDTTQTYLQIKVKANTGDVWLDSSAFCFFQRLQVLSSGQVLEDINEYANFCNMSIDAGVGPAVRQTAANVMMGTFCDSPSSTNYLNILRGGVKISAGTTQVFTLPLISGILGAQGNTKYLPSGAINSDLRLELTLHQSNNAVINVNAAPTSWAITEANLMLSYIELDSEVQKMIDAQTNGNYYISSETWRCYTNAIANGSQNDTILVPARFASVKGILHTLRPTGAQNDYLKAAQTHRYNPFVGSGTISVQYTIGPLIYPNTPIRSSPELFAELQRYFHNLSNSNINGSLTSGNYTVIADPTALATSANDAAVLSYFNSSGAGVWGINTDQIANRSDVMTSGINTLNSNIILNMYYGTSIPAASRLDSYVHIDMIIKIEGGVMTVAV